MIKIIDLIGCLFCLVFSLCIVNQSLNYYQQYDDNFFLAAIITFVALSIILVFLFIVLWKQWRKDQ